MDGKSIVRPRHYFLGAAALIVGGVVLGLGLSAGLNLPPATHAANATFRASPRAAALPDSPFVQRWIPLAREKVAFQGLPARICWLGYGERAKAGLLLNDLVARGAIKAPVVIGRDPVNSGSVASPYRETDPMVA